MQVMATNQQHPPAEKTALRCVSARTTLGRGVQLCMHASFFARCAALHAALLPLVALPPGPRRSALARNHIRRGCAAFLGRLADSGCVHVEYEGFEGCADWGGSLICANHPSLLDALILFSKIPSAVCVVGRTPWKDPLFALPARMADYIPSEPAARMVRECRNRLRGGGAVLVFPEGTRTPRGALGPFHSGYALAAMRAEAPVRTVFIECDSMALGKGFAFFRAGSLPVRFRISAGEVFAPTAAKSTREFAARLEGYFREHLVRTADGIGLRTRQ
jgi:1-acyl-sn-glycerol-3-phosphate acyltransferase